MTRTRFASYAAALVSGIAAICILALAMHEGDVRVGLALYVAVASALAGGLAGAVAGRTRAALAGKVEAEPARAPLRGGPSRSTTVITPTSVPATASDLRTGVELERQAKAERKQQEILGRFLADIRDILGADEVIFWRWAATAEVLLPAACSTEDSESPAHFVEDSWTSLVRWSADQNVVHFDDSVPTPHIAAGPVAIQKHGLGALSITATGGLRLRRDELKHWLPRYCAQVASLTELLEARDNVAVQNRRMQAMLSAARRLQTTRDLTELGASICQTALDVTSAKRAALVHWKADASSGVIRAVSDGHALPSGFAITRDSQVGVMCRNALPQVWEDARFVSRDNVIYGESEQRRSMGSLAIIPLKREQHVLGAIVIEGDKARDVLIADVRNVSLLAAIATASLETLWEIEEVSKRARTDQLTGLWNRRHFDEQLGRVLAETDRFGEPTTLLIADVDFFKMVNDTHGHDAGDAVLCHIASVFQEGVRAIDVAARFGGEEFAVLLPRTTLSGAEELAERLRVAVAARPARISGKEIPVTVSIGVAAYPECAKLHESLFAAADRALYRAKAEGRNQVRCAPVTLAARTA